MSIQIGNAPCSWGVEFANDPRNPPWRDVLKDCSEAGYKGIELGPVGFMPEDKVELAEALNQFGLELIGGVVFRPFHDLNSWDDVMDGAVRTCKALMAHGAKHLVLIDSISPRRERTAGRADEAEIMEHDEWILFRDRIVTIAKLAAEEFGLIPELHPHAGGFIDFEKEVEKILAEVDTKILKLCIDTGHCTYAGFDPIKFMKKHKNKVFQTSARKIEKIIKNLPASIDYHLDFCDFPGFDYHSGLVFSVHVLGFGFSIAKGGQYKSMQNHTVREAIGFDVNVSSLTKLNK